MNITEKEIKTVYMMLKNRRIHPSGDFDKQGRWYAKHESLISVRSPSKSYPYSEMTACRTLKYCKAVASKFNCKNKQELMLHV